MPDNTDIHILQTKLIRPAIDSNWVRRPRLIDHFNRNPKNRLTLVSAPAGYGKTTLVLQWLGHISQPSAWLSLDEQDGDPDRFLKYFIAAIQDVSPGFGPNSESLRLSSTLVPPDHLADALISDLTELKNPLVIVFDDLHSIASEPVQANSYPNDSISAGQRTPGYLDTQRSAADAGAVARSKLANGISCSRTTVYQRGGASVLR